MKLLIDFLYKHFRIASVEYRWLKQHLGYIDSTATFDLPMLCTCPSKVFLYENTNINSNSQLIISPLGEEGRLVFKRNSGAASGLTVITGNHQRAVGTFFKESSVQHIGDIDKDVLVEEDVWIGANVTLLPGITIGRGATVGAGSVCFKSIPPYAMVMGNPAKVVGFNFNPEQVIEHEIALYPEEERISLELLQKNYEKYFLNRIKDIKQFTKL